MRGVDMQIRVFLTSALVGWVVSFTPRPLYPQGKSPWYSLDKMLGGPLKPVWMTWRGEKSCPYRDSKSDPSAVRPAASHYTDCPISIQLQGRRDAALLSSSWGFSQIRRCMEVRSFERFVNYYQNTRRHIPYSWSRPWEPQSHVY
jgi:hypothetical protein